MKITYKFADGETTEIEMSEEWSAFVLDLNRLDYNCNQRETRRHCSLEAFNLDDAYFSSNVNAKDEVIRNESRENLEVAIAQLLSEQRRLICEIYFEGTAKRNDHRGRDD